MVGNAFYTLQVKIPFEAKGNLLYHSFRLTTSLNLSLVRWPISWPHPKDEARTSLTRITRRQSTEVSSRPKSNWSNLSASWPQSLAWDANLSYTSRWKQTLHICVLWWTFLDEFCTLLSITICNIFRSMKLEAPHCPSLLPEVPSSHFSPSPPQCWSIGWARNTWQRCSTTG